MTKPTANSPKNRNLHYQNVDLTAIQNFKGTLNVIKPELTCAINVQTKPEENKNKREALKAKSSTLKSVSEEWKSRRAVSISQRADSEPLLGGSSCRATPAEGALGSGEVLGFLTDPTLHWGHCQTPTAGHGALNPHCYGKRKAIYRNVEFKSMFFWSLAEEVFWCSLCWPLSSPRTWNHQHWFLFSEKNCFSTTHEQTAWDILEKAE